MENIDNEERDLIEKVEEYTSKILTRIKKLDYALSEVFKLHSFLRMDSMTKSIEFHFKHAMLFAYEKDELSFNLALTRLQESFNGLINLAKDAY